MPFTFSHPLYAAPLKKGIPQLSMTGLVLGSIAPDMEYFIAMQPFRSVGHSLEGFFLMVMPICIALAFAFHRIVMPLLLDILPSNGGINRFVTEAAHPWRLSSPAAWLLFCLSLFIGFLSHLFMDNWTHGSGWFVHRLPFLQSIIAGDEVYHILQLSLSVIGAAVPVFMIAYKWYGWKRTNPAHARNDRGGSSAKSYWLALIVLSFIMLIGKLVSSGAYFSLSVWIVAPITAALFSLFVTGLWRAAKQTKQNEKGLSFILALFGAIALYMIASSYTGFLIWLWIVYIWILAILILWSTIALTKNKAE
ncbi:DUF4184 family protein [Paenibacillus harenae]|uniref:DUF4184 family protein n=1 Tax=Paenibacillus harenae TaxID=306543 RepID=UPI0004231176|nr:DUF4184 family protein [Paenibacillus harenae]